MSEKEVASVWLVGNAHSQKHNNWMAMCATKERAEKLKKHLPHATLIKEAFYECR